jgi:tetratricopeptide (TPR) repeat protein
VAEDSEDEPQGAAPDALGQTGAAAIEVALGRRGRGARPDPRLDAFLDEQTRFLKLQSEHLHEQRGLQLAHLKVRRWKDRLSLTLQTLGVALGAVVVVAVAAMAWRAHEDHGVVIDAFSVPPELARNGLTGEVAAARFLDKLQAMQTATAASDRPAQTFANNWGSEIKVEIPDTGLTFGEFEKLLRDRLGHVTRASGEVLKTATGVELTVRLGDAPPQTFAGPDAVFDSLAQKSAEAVYRAAQPYRYVEYLDQHGRAEEAFEVVADLAVSGPPEERGWAYAKWAFMDINDHGDAASARLHGAKGLGFGAGSDLSDRISMVSIAVWTGEDEPSLNISELLEAAARKRLPGTSRFFYEDNKLLAAAWLEFILPDFKASAADWMRIPSEDPRSSYVVVAPAMAATAYALDHDPAAARQAMTSLQGREETTYMWDIARGAFPALPGYWIAAETGAWPAALADARTVDVWLEANKVQRPLYGLMQKTWIWPLEALALAKSGDMAGAEALIGRTPPDCGLCLRVRGQIAAQARDWPGAGRWFAEAVRQAPSVPNAYADWGAMLLAKGDADAAIAKLQIAHAKGPRFADPLEAWGEALMRKGDYAGAAAKFREAAAYAPHWRRNQAMLSQASAKAGRGVTANVASPGSADH